jgi:membrane protein YdbS with pleckstrin-like domain
MRIGTLLVVIWLLIGALAAYQRDYFSGDDPNCAEVGTIAITIVAGPLNYLGVNPTVDNCPEAPQPSQ